MQRICVLVAAIAGCIALGAVWWFKAVPIGANEDEPDSYTPAPTTAEREALAGVVAEVAKQGRTPASRPVVQAAPQPIPSGFGAPRDGATSPLPPAGYEFVEHHGEIRTHRYEPGRADTNSPLDDGPDWLRAVDAVPRLIAQAEAAARDWSFGWILLQGESRLADVESRLAALGVDAVGSAGPLIRARLPADGSRLDAVAALPAVAALGAQPLNAKLPASLTERARGQPASEVVPVFVTLMADDTDGRWRHALQALGTVVGSYDAHTRSYVANIRVGALETVAAADFVQFVEPVGTVRATLDTAVPGMGADVLRTYDETLDTFTGTGGAGVPIAVMDSGLNVNHPDIASSRDSICGANFIALDREEEQDLWADARGHGTHVTGTIVGNGTITPAYAGMAPLVGDVRFAKVLNRFGLGPFTAINAGMDFLSEASECSAGGWSSDLVKPLIVNMSLSAPGLIYEGRDQPARKLDAVVWHHRQLYVVAQANRDVHGFSNYGAAKNSLAVGAVLDSGELAAFSSHGPTADGRLSPLVVGTGVNLNSVAGAGSPTGYRTLSGTSMAAPAVAGVAALLMDAEPSHREQPALTRARLMASAIKPDAWLDDARAFPSDNSLGPGTMNARFGLGKVAAPVAVLARDQDDGWTSGSATATFGDGEYAYHDIVIPQGSSRVDVVLTWDEPPAEAIASTVFNDLDLWVDEGADCAGVACGEHSSVSRRDNVEWVIVRNPTPGTWRVKVAAARVYTDAPRAALAWTVIRGPSTPELAVSADKTTWDPISGVAITVTANGYVAAGTHLKIECRTTSSAQSGDEDPPISPCDSGSVHAITNADGLERPTHYTTGFVPLGDIAAGESRSVLLTGISHDPARAIHITASAWNAAAASISVPMSATTTDAAKVVAVPGNDAFDSAELLMGAHGRSQVDLLHASPEPGEADFASGSGRPAGSAWYRWKATAAGPVHFGVALTDAFLLGGPDALDRWETRVDVYEGDKLAGLRTVASSPWGASFFAVPGTDYAVRVAAGNRLGRVAVYWQRGERPGNDRFDAATAITGTEGSEAGTNLGATLDPGEYHGGLGGTVWYAWTAPVDGTWEFRSNAGQLKVLAFSGGTIDDLRLVSGYPSATARFPARSGASYRIAVATGDAFAAGSEFVLSWASVEGASTDDGFAGATGLPAAESSSWQASNNPQATVEPGEPSATGVRTVWRSWTAPATGEFTWRVTGSLGLSLAAFSGDSLETLDHLATASDASGEFVIRTEKDETYRFAVGAINGHASAFTTAYVGGSVDFGPTPSNDAWTSTAVLAGSSGTVTGSNRYATTQPYERIWDVGHSSVWWTFEGPADGWYRFWVDETSQPFTLSAYAHGTGPPGQLPMIVSSRPDLDDGRIEVVIQVAAGNRYAIRLGTFGRAQGGDFSLHWQETEAPDFLRYAGRFAFDVENARGDTVGIDGIGALAFEDTGQALYAATEPGLAVFKRDADAGSLTLTQFSAGDVSTNTGLFWDSENARLLAFSGCEAKIFAAIDGTYTQLGEDGTLSVTGEAPCDIVRVIADSTRSLLYTVSRSSNIRVYAYEDGDVLRHVQTHPLTINDAVISNTGGHVYAIENYTLHTLERDRDTGELAEVDQTSLADQALSLAVSADGSHLFTVGRVATVVYSLADPAAPRALSSLSPPTQGYFNLNCSFAVARGEGSLADAFCTNSAFTVAWDADADRHAIADFVSSWRANRYGQLLPDLYPSALAASPDGRHAYAGTFAQGISAFERVGNPVVEVGPRADGGYVRLGTLKVSEGQVELGPLSSSGCITVVDLTVNDILYDVDTSKWQIRADVAGTWTDVDDTETTGELCAYTPTSAGQYRLVANIEIDGAAGNYASNVMNYQAQ